MIKKTEYKNIGETLYYGELANGLRICVVPKPGFGSYYAIFGTNYGGAMRDFELEGEKIHTPAGVAHFLEHKMFDLPNGDNALEMLSSNGADPNAFTSSGVTMYYFKCTSGFEDNLKLLLHFVSTPYFTPETVEKEQGIIGQEIQMGEDSPGSAIYYNLLSQLYSHHPIKDKVAGSIESIAEITDKTLYDCHKVFYSPSNMVLCVEGDVDPERIFEIAEQELDSQKMPIPHADYGAAENLLPIEYRKEVEMPVSAPQFLIGAKLNNPDNIQGRDQLKFRITATFTLKLLFGSSSKFYAKLYSDGILNHDFDADVDFSAGTSTLLIGGESLYPDRVLEEINKEIDRILHEGFDPGYFERSKRAAMGQHLRGYEDFDNVCVSLAMDMIDGFCSFDALDILKGITQDECINWVRENITSEKLAISIISPIKDA